MEWWASQRDSRGTQGSSCWNQMQWCLPFPGNTDTDLVDPTQSKFVHLPGGPRTTEDFFVSAPDGPNLLALGKPPEAAGLTPRSPGQWSVPSFYVLYCPRHIASVVSYRRDFKLWKLKLSQNPNENTVGLRDKASNGKCQRDKNLTTLYNIVTAEVLRGLSVHGGQMFDCKWTSAIAVFLKQLNYLQISLLSKYLHAAQIQN